MRQQEGQYGDPSANTSYFTSQMQQHQRMEAKSGNFEERLEAFTPERENPYANSKPEGQWRWEMDESKMSNSMQSSRMFNEGKCCSSHCLLGLAYVPFYQRLYSHTHTHIMNIC